MRTRTTFPVIVALVILGGACIDSEGSDDEAGDASPGSSERGGVGTSRHALVPGPVAINDRRSLAITETAIVSGFLLRDVMNQLAAQSGVVGLSGTLMFQQLWDTQRPKPGLTNGPHCDDVLAGGQPLVNAFPYGCRTAEGAQAGNPDFELDNYKAIGLFNRFDLAPVNGADCGEYRIIFARNPSGIARNFIIFEAVLANPHPEIGLEACRPVANFWHGLSANNDIVARKNALKSFYFTGLAGFSPVIHMDNYGVLGAGRSTTGQVRTNQFLQQPWMLREFKLKKTCGVNCTLHFTPVTDKTNPFGGLFSSGSPQPLAGEFQGTFLPSQVPSLAVADINLFNYTVSDQYNTGESASQAPTQNDYLSNFNPGSTFASKIQTKLDELGSPLTPSQIVARAEALSCAGCHQLSNGQNLGGGITWPSSLGFVHVSEQSTEIGPDGTRFVLSSALRNVFLPRRKVVFESFLNQPAPLNDYTGDRKADMVAFRPGNRTMNVLTSVSDWQSVITKTVGQVGDQSVAGSDYDGDGLADMAVWRSSTGVWTIKGSLTGWQTAFTRAIGASSDVPIAGADLDGDRKAEIIVFRPSNGTWSVLLSSTDWQTSTHITFGVSTDVPLTPADYDGDRKADLVIYRPGNRTMNVLSSAANNQVVVTRTVGKVGDTPVAGADYDGDGQADMAVWRATDGTWTIKTSSSNWQISTTTVFGAQGDTPLTGTDFDGDAKADPVFFRPSDGTWNAKLSSSGGASTLVRTFGVSSDVPLTR